MNDAISIGLTPYIIIDGEKLEYIPNTFRKTENFMEVSVYLTKETKHFLTQQPKIIEITVDDETFFKKELKETEIEDLYEIEGCFIMNLIFYW